jgi:hypothetical protein
MSSSYTSAAEGSLPRTCPLGYISHPLFTIPLLLWQARLMTAGSQLVCACQRTQQHSYHVVRVLYNS